jgi:serine protease Do
MTKTVIAAAPTLTAIFLMSLLACPIALAQTAPVPAQTSVKLSQVLIDLPVGTPWLSVYVDSLCIQGHRSETWSHGRERQAISPYAVPFKTELERAGYKVVTPGEDNLFDPESASADYEVAAVITDEHIDGCVNDGGYFTQRGTVRGESTMKVNWQLYSPLRKQVVARASTSGTAKLERSVSGGLAVLITLAFADNVHSLATNSDFRAALSASKVLPATGILLPGQQSKIALAGSLKSQKVPVADAVGSVVTLMTGLGTGSGVLVSDDGYMLTNAHVVGDDKEIRVRWSDGIETIAQIVRVAKDRDIALVKTNPRDRPPLAIKRGAVTPGQRVYAIGSPKGQTYQGSVSSGIVSATRIMEGLRYIQSDVAISHGSSGGALLNENGAVIGIAVSGFEASDATGLNFFIPIGDAMDFLNLEQK